VLRRVMRGPANRIHRIPCGRDFSQFLPERTEAVWRYRAAHGWPPEAIVFAVVGTFHLPRGKGQLEFLQAASVLRADFPQARFVILGYGEMKPLLRERITALGLNDVAQVMDFHYDIETFMSAIDVLVHPTTEGEAFSLVTIEALASGRPVIASRKDGIVDCFTHGEHGLLLPPGDVPALTDAMRTMLTNPDLRHRLGTAGSAHVRATFSQARLARRTRELYVRLCRH
jgi:glycosyltransferase involved in cell wall biosynthesis